MGYHLSVVRKVGIMTEHHYFKVISQAVNLQGAGAKRVDHGPVHVAIL